MDAQENAWENDSQGKPWEGVDSQENAWEIYLIAIAREDIDIELPGERLGKRLPGKALGNACQGNAWETCQGFAWEICQGFSWETFARDFPGNQVRRPCLKN